MGWLSAFFPGKIWFYLAAAGIIFTAGASGAWKVQQWRMDSQERDRVQTQLVAEREFAKNEAKRAEIQLAALNAARSREAGARADAALTRDALGRVRDSADALAERAKASLSACIDATTAFKTVYNSCAGRYTELGENSQRHVGDIQTLIDSWPKENLP